MEHIDKVTADSLRGFVEAIRRTLRDVWIEYRKPFLGFSLVMALLSVVPFVISGVQALLINHLVKDFVLSIWTVGILWSVVALVVLFYVREYLGTLSNYLERKSWMRIRSDYEHRLSKKLVSLDMATHEDAEFRDKLMVVQENGAAFAVARFIFMLVGNIGMGTSVVVASAAIFAADWKIFLVILLGSIPRLGVELKYGEGLWSIYQSSAENRREYQEFRRHTQRRASIRDIQASQSSEFFLGRQRRLLTEFLTLEQGRDKVRYYRLLLSHVLTIATLAFGLVFLVGRVVDGTMQIGTFTFFSSAMVSFQGAIQGFFLSFADQHRMAKPVLALFEIFEKTPAVVSPSNGVKLSLESSPQIEFRNVSFAYPTRPDDLILNNFSLTIKPGEHLAIVGMNGAGKSTLIKLLCRLYDPIAGQILVNDVDLRDLSLPSWYEHLALLAQDYSSYRFKVWEVIALGRMSGSRNQTKIRNAARRAQASEFIEKWEEGYDQQLGAMFTNGVEVSGGQRQKLALARTFYREALVSILDEPAAHLDPSAERDLFEVMEDETGADQSLILITHRLSTVRGVDRICVISDGTVHEIGSHRELMRARGTYANLFESQSEGYR